MVTLQLQKFLDEQNLSVQELSDRTDIPMTSIENYLSLSNVTLEGQVISDLMKIANNLKVPTLRLLKSVNPVIGFRLQLRKVAQQKNVTLSELHQRSGIDLTTLKLYDALYFTEQNLSAEPQKSNLIKICDFLECQTSDILFQEEFSIFYIDVEALAVKKGISLESLALVSNLSVHTLHLLISNPVGLDFLNLLWKASMQEEGLLDLIGCVVKKC
jgi:DNA-binding Xre family transcriptional regulator